MIARGRPAGGLFALEVEPMHAAYCGGGGTSLDSGRLLPPAAQNLA